MLISYKSYILVNNLNYNTQSHRMATDYQNLPAVDDFTIFMQVLSTSSFEPADYSLTHLEKYFDFQINGNSNYR
jgi:hypothetical protein